MRISIEKTTCALKNAFTLVCVKNRPQMKRNARRRTAKRWFCCARARSTLYTCVPYSFYKLLSPCGGRFLFGQYCGSASHVFVLVYSSESRCRMLFVEKRSHVTEAHFYQNQNRGFAFTAQHSTHKHNLNTLNMYHYQCAHTHTRVCWRAQRAAASVET